MTAVTASKPDRGATAEFYEPTFAGAFDAPARTSQVALEEPPLVADLVDDAEASPAVPVEVRQPLNLEKPVNLKPVSWEPSTGGPQFVGAPRTSAPIVPAGVRPMPSAQLHGTLLPIWTLAKPKSRRSRWRRCLRRFAVDLLVIAALVAGGYVAYPQVRTLVAARFVSPDLRSFVEGGGTAYSPAGQGYSVRLPKPPVSRDSLLTGSNEIVSIFEQRAVVAGADYQIVIRVGHIMNGTLLPKGIGGAIADPAIVGTGTPTNVHRVAFAGQSAFDYDLGASPPREGRIFLNDGRLYVFTVQARSAGTVLDALAKSFHFVPAGNTPR